MTKQKKIIRSRPLGSCSPSELTGHLDKYTPLCKRVCSTRSVKHITHGQKAHKDNFIINENLGDIHQSDSKTLKEFLLTQTGAAKSFISLNNN